MNALRHLARLGLERIRSGQRLILWPKEEIRFGNLLYFWLQADLRQSKGEEVLVRGNRHADPWRDEFPVIFEKLHLDGGDVRFRDRRELGMYQAFGHHYQLSELESFVQRFILPAPGIQRFSRLADELGVSDGSTVVCNVRRGDYYSNPEYRSRYGFDVHGYIEEALERIEGRGKCERVLFVSDDVGWCTASFEKWGRVRGVELLSFQGPNPARDFALLGHAKRLILANSTFSYWGGYTSIVNGGGAEVVAPWFHARDWLNGRSFHLHPGWSVVEGHY